MTETYDQRTGERRGERVCGYCGALRRIVPLAHTPENWHDSAECVAMPEPMGRCQ